MPGACAKSGAASKTQAQDARPPATLYRDLGPIERTMRDMVRGDVARVLIDDAARPKRRAPIAAKRMPRRGNA